MLSGSGWALDSVLTLPRHQWFIIQLDLQWEGLMSHSFQLSLLTGCALLFAACNDDQSPLQPSTTEDPSALSPALAAAATGSWSSKAPLPIPRYHHEAATVTNSAGQQLVYLFGGIDDSCTDTGRCPVEQIDVYNLATDSWITKSSEFSGEALNGAGVIGSRVYLAGGANAGGRTIRNSLFVYDTRTDTWLQKAPMPSASRDGVSGVINGKLYVLTGGDNGGASRKFYRYNPATNTWASRPWPKHSHAGGAAGVINGKFYVAGGFGHGILEIYDPATNRWSTGAPMPSPRWSAAGAVLGSRLYIIGGGSGKVGEDLNEVTVYDPGTNRWMSRAPLTWGRSRLAAARVDTHILALGGDKGNSDKNEMFTR
jgi:N-acetylneuraminic acid mutarotase